MTDADLDALDTRRLDDGSALDLEAPHWSKRNTAVNTNLQRLILATIDTVNFGCRHRRAIYICVAIDKLSVVPDTDLITQLELPRAWHGHTKITVTRTQFAAAPACVRTAHLSIGGTFDSMLVDLNVSKGAKKDMSLIIYVLLSRVATIDKLLILRAFNRDDLRKAFPANIIEELERLDRLDQAAAASTHRRPGSIMPSNAELIALFEQMFAIAQEMNEQHLTPQ